MLLLHSSLSSIGHVAGGAPTVVAALENVLGAGGTLILPTHTWSIMNKGCRDFDVSATRSYVGTMSEVFRNGAGVVRSLHPTHSVAAKGARAREVVADHELASTPCGEGTPYSRLLAEAGQILLLGVGLKRNTCFHAVEAIAGVPYLMNEQPSEFTIRDQSGEARLHSVFMHAPAKLSRFNELEDLFVAEGILRRGRVGQARSLLIEGKRFRDFMLARLNEDPEFLLKQA